MPWSQPLDISLLAPALRLPTLLFCDSDLCLNSNSQSFLFHNLYILWCIILRNNYKALLIRPDSAYRITENDPCYHEKILYFSKKELLSIMHYLYGSFWMKLFREDGIRAWGLLTNGMRDYPNYLLLISFCSHVWYRIYVALPDCLEDLLNCITNK